MRKSLLHTIIILAGCVFIDFNSGYSQDIPATSEPEIQIIKGRRFYVHTVQKEETLYGISKRYEVEIKDIVLENPLAINGLDAGQTLKIPVPIKIIDTRALDGKFFYHTIQPGETYYSLSRQYETTVEVLQAANPEMVVGLKAGVSMRIPITQAMKENAGELGATDPDEEEMERDTLYEADTLFSQGWVDTTLVVGIPKDSMVFRDTYNITIMLPFYLDANDSVNAKRKPDDHLTVYGRSKVALAFYKGALLALDSMEKEGMSIHVFVYDTNNDTATVRKILERDELERTDLIIGPLYRSNLSLVVDFARGRNIEVVSPLITTNRILRGNPHLSKAEPCVQTYVDGLASYIKHTFYADTSLSLNEMNLVIIHNEDPGEKLLAKRFTDKISHHPAKQDSLQERYKMPEIKMVSYRERGMQAVEEALSIADTNILVVPSRDQAFVSKLTSDLYNKQEEYNVIVFGLPVWKNFYNIDGNKLHQQHIHLASSSYINYESPPVKKFVLGYYNRFNSYPSQHAFQGYDLTFYFLNVLKTYGYNFQTYLPEAQIPTLQTEYSFQPIPGGGYENQKVYILKYEGYELRLVTSL